MVTDFPIPTDTREGRTVAAFCFGPFRLSVSNRILEREGERIPVTPKVVETLLVLLENSGEVVSKEELMQAVWPDVTVVESGLSRNISVLRKAIEDEKGTESYIETIPRRGYRFVGEIHIETVEDSSDSHSSQSAGPHSTLGAFHHEPESRTSLSLPVGGSGFHFPRIPRSGLAAGFALAFVVCCLAIGVWSRGEAPVYARSRDTNVRIGEHLLYKLTPAETERARDYFEKAALANPRSSDAQAGLALSAVHLMNFGLMPAEVAIPAAAESAQRALELDQHSPSALTAIGVVQVVQRGDFHGADASFRHALELDPSSVQIRSYFSRIKLALGDLEGARQMIDEAARLDPVSPSLGTQAGILAYFGRDFEVAVAEFRKVLDREPGYGLAHYYLGLSLGFLGKYEEAETNLMKSKQNPNVLEVDLAWLHALQGDIRPVKDLLEQRRALVSARDVNPSAKLVLAATLGLVDEGIEAVDSVVESRSPELLTLRMEPRLDSLRSDPRYMAALQRAGLDSGSSRPVSRP